MKALRSFETSAKTNPETQRQIAEEQVLVTTLGN
jgi:hypothetical protein